jgi:hypothetical protein
MKEGLNIFVIVHNATVDLYPTMAVKRHLMNTDHHLRRNTQAAQQTSRNG